MEAVLQRPRIYIRGNVYNEAKAFFTNVFNRRKLKSKVKTDKMAVKNTNARVIPVEQTMSALSSVFSTETIVELYKTRIENANKKITELKEKIKNCKDSEKEVLQSELDSYIENLKVDSYILEVKKEELAQENNIQNEIPEPNEPTEPEPSAPHEPPQDDNHDEEKEESNEYATLYNSIKSLFEDKINLSSGRLERINNITNFINNINADANDLEGKLAFITYFNISFITNYEQELHVDQELNDKIKRIYEIKPDFNINEEFGELTRKITIPSEDMLHNYEKTILAKKYNLEQTGYSKYPDEQNIIKNIIEQLDISLNNLKYNIDEPKKSESMSDANKQIIESPQDIISAPESDNGTSLAESSEESAILEEEPSIIPDEQLIESTSEATPALEEEQNDENKIEEQATIEEENVVSSTKKLSPTEELKNKLFDELKKQYQKINSINDIVSNPLKMTYEATIYFEEIATKTNKKIKELESNLRSMSKVFSYEIEDQEVFPGSLDDFIKLHKEKMYRANDELMALQQKEDKDEKTLKRIDTINKYLATEKEIVERRIIFEKKKNSTFNVSDYLSQLQKDNSVEKQQQSPISPTPVITETHVEKTRIKVVKPQKISRERALIEKYQPVTVERLENSIKLIINNEARQKLKKILGDIKIIINNNQGLNGVTVNMKKTNAGNIIESISNLDKLDNLKIVLERDGQEIESKEIVSHSLSK